MPSPVMQPERAPLTAPPIGMPTSLPLVSNRYANPATTQLTLLIGTQQPARGTQLRSTIHWIDPAKAPANANATPNPGNMTLVEPSSPPATPIARFIPKPVARKPKNEPTPLTKTHQPARATH